MASRRKGRIAAFQALYALECGACLEDLTFDWSTGDTVPEWVPFARLLLQGTVDNLPAVDEIIAAHLDHWDISRLKKVDLAILRLSSYALLYQSSIPANVTIDEAVHIAKEFSANESYRFINGVLDAINRDFQSRSRGNTGS